MKRGQTKKSFERAVFDGDINGPNWPVVSAATEKPVMPGSQNYGHTKPGREVISQKSDRLPLKVIDYQEPALPKHNTRERFLEGMFNGDHMGVWMAVMDIEPPETFRIVDLHERLDDLDMHAKRHTAYAVNDLFELGMITAIAGPPEHEELMFYQKTGSPAWDIVRTAAQVADTLFPPDAK